MKISLCSLACLLAACGAAAPKAAQAAAGLEHPESAVPISPGYWQAGLLSSTYYGVSEGVALSLHPLLSFALPHLEARVTWWQRGDVYLGTLQRVAYATPFLRLVSREGSGGLLPSNTEVPQALQVAGEAWVSTTRLPGQVLSVFAGVSGALVGASKNLSLLDFPFLYQRFADLEAPWVVRYGAALEGGVGDAFYYSLETKSWLFRLPEPRLAAIVFESTLRVGYEPHSNWRMLMGFKTALGRFPIGVRSHWLPLVDVQHAF